MELAKKILDYTLKALDGGVYTVEAKTTLENANYIIPDGSYPVSITYSPRFQKNLPLIDKVPGRSGIRIHTGTQPEHSQGCVLVNPKDKERIIEFINQNAKNNEETFICISSAF